LADLLKAAGVERGLAMMATNNKKALEQEPGEIEALLPWHAAGTLRCARYPPRRRCACARSCAGEAVCGD